MMKLLVVVLCVVVLVDSAFWWGKKKYKKKGTMTIEGRTYKYKIKEVKRDEPQLEEMAPDVDNQREVHWDEYDDQRN